MKKVDFYKVIPEKESERFKIEHFELSEEKVKFEKTISSFNGRYGEVYDLEAGKYIKLIDKKRHQIVMSDTPMEIRTNNEFIRRANGKVLIGGLGLGIILVEIQKKEEVESVLVIEKYQEIIDLVKPSLPINGKVKIVLGDILDFKTKEKFDTIYFDIWNSVGDEEDYKEMKFLHRRFSRNLNRENERSWMSSWRKKDFQEENRGGRYW